MRAAGMDSYAAMTMAGSRIEDLPADQFNHCVTALKKKDGKFEMYDPTWVPNYRDIWSKLETEQHYVVGTPEGEDLSRIAYSPPEESPLNVKSKAELDEYGNLTGYFELRGDGAVDSRLRRMLAGARKKDLTDYIAGTLKRISDNVRSIKIEHCELEDFSQGMWWKIKYEIPDYAFPVAGGLEFKSPMMMLTMHNRLLLRPGDHEWKEGRKNDLFLYYTQYLNGTEEIKVPKGYKLIDTPQKEDIDEVFASFSGNCEMKKRNVKIKQEVKLKRRQIPPDEYEGFRKAINAASDYSETVFRVEKGGAK